MQILITLGVMAVAVLQTSSFGTALKLVDTKHWGHSAAMAAATVLAFMMTPPTKVFVENITSRALWSELHHRLLPPQNKWFQGMAWVLENPPAVKANTVPVVGSPISTGSILPGPVEAPKDK